MMLEKLNTMGTMPLLLLLLSLQILVAWWGLSSGLTEISVSALPGMFTGNADDEIAARILYELRLPRVLNVLLLGRDTAITLGVNAKDYLTKYLFCNGLLVGLIVYNAGMIGFIGLVLPHIVRSLLGADHRVLLPAAVMLGGIAAVLLDILSRSGVMFALVGAPLFIYLVFRRKYGAFL